MQLLQSTQIADEENEAQIVAQGSGTVSKNKVNPRSEVKELRDYCPLFQYISVMMYCNPYSDIYVTPRTGHLNNVCLNPGKQTVEVLCFRIKT